MMLQKNVNNKWFAYFLSLSLLFIMSCESYNETRYPIVLFILIIAVFYIIFFLGEISRKTTLNFFCFFVIILAIGWMSSLPIFSFKQNIINYSFSDFIIPTLFKLITSFIILILCKSTKCFGKVVSGVIKIHLFFFYMQTIIVYVSGHYIDLLYYFTGELQRYESLFSLPIIGTVYRPTGLYVEPSTFSSFILWLLAIKILAQKQIERFDIFVIISAMMSLSLAALIYGSLFLVAIVLFSSSITLIKKTQFLILFSITPFLFYMIFQARLDALGGSGESLRQNLNNLVFAQDWLTLFFGNGLLGLPNEVSHLTTGAELWRLGIAALNDNGLWLFFIIKIGYVGLFMVVFFAYILTPKKIDFFIFIVLLLTKITFLSFIFIFYIFILAENSKRES